MDNLLQELEEQAKTAHEQENLSAENTTNLQTETVDNTTDTQTQNTNGDEKIIEQPEQSKSVNTQESPVGEKAKEAKKTFANEELERLNDFLLKHPNKSIEDYNQLKKPIESFSEEDLLRNFYSEKEGMTEAEIAYELKRLEKKETDDEFGDELDELEVLKLNAEREKILKEAKDFRANQVQEFLAEKEAETHELPKQESEIQTFLQEQEKLAKAERNEYLKEIYEVLPEITEVELQLNGESIKFVPDEEFNKEMRLVAEDVSYATQKYFDKNGKMTDKKGFIENAALWVNPKTRQPMIDFMIEQAVTRDRAERDKVARNITLDKPNGTSVQGSIDGAEAFEAFMRERNASNF